MKIQKLNRLLKIKNSGNKVLLRASLDPSVQTSKINEEFIQDKIKIYDKFLNKNKTLSKKYDFTKYLF